MCTFKWFEIQLSAELLKYFYSTNSDNSSTNFSTNSSTILWQKQIEELIFAPVLFVQKESLSADEEEFL